MKNIWIISLSALAIAMSGVSCSQEDAIDVLQADGSENVSQGDKKLVKTTFKAYVPSWGNGSRTSLEEGNIVYWTNNDEIAITTQRASLDYGIYKCVANFEEEKAASADFEGEVPTNYYQYFAFYPYDLMKGQENNMTLFWIPEQQEAVAGSFANNLNPAWATTERLGGTLYFQNLGALVKLTINDGAEELESVRLFANNANKRLTGDFIYDSNLSNTELRNAGYYDSKHFSSVTLKGSFTSGSSYYFVVAPAEKDILAEGFKLVFKKNDGTEYVMDGAAGVINSVQSAEIVNIGEVSLAGKEFANKISDFNFINAVNRNFEGGLNWVADEDGTIPLTQKNLDMMSAVEFLNLDGAGLTSIDYLKYFTGLKTLDCSNNSLEYVDLNYLTKLRELYIYNSNVKELKIDNLVSLECLDCGNNNLSELNIANLSNITTLFCYDNNLNELELGNLDKLIQLNCTNNNISSLDLAGKEQLIALSCDGNPINSIDTANLPNLVELSVSYTNISDIAIPYPEKIRYLNISATGIKSVDFSKFTSLKDLFCYNMANFITELDLSNNPELQTLSCSDSKITELNLKKNTQLKSLWCGFNNLTELDLTYNTSLLNLDCIMQNMGEGPKLKLYLNEAQRTLWENIEYSHSEYVDVYFNGSEAAE